MQTNKLLVPANSTLRTVLFAFTSALSTQHSALLPRRLAVAVSGGADSVALLLLLRQQPELTLHVVHLDHQTRGSESTGDAAFVKELATKLGFELTVELRSTVEATMTDLPANTSARHRAARLALFRRVVVEHHLAGVALAHHADDQAETILQRLLRGSGPMGLAAMEQRSDLGELVLYRPLLNVTRQELREFLHSHGQNWREDASNDSDDYFRNRLRRFLATQPSIAADLLELGRACGDLRTWSRKTAPTLDPIFPIAQLAAITPPLASESARRWLIERGVPPDKILPAVIDRLVTMATDRASPPRAHFPGEILVRRRKGMIFVDG